MTDGRVNGSLNLSRALGDMEYKQSADLQAAEQIVTAVPEVGKLTFKGYSSACEADPHNDDPARGTPADTQPRVQRHCMSPHGAGDLVWSLLHAGGTLSQQHSFCGAGAPAGTDVG